VDTEKKPDEQKTDQPKQDIGEIVGDLVVSGATLLAHSVAETVVKRVKKAAAKLAPVEAVNKVEKKAKKSAAGTKVTKPKKANSIAPSLSDSYEKKIRTIRGFPSESKVVTRMFHPAGILQSKDSALSSGRCRNGSHQLI
jgi:hypothetical protein